MLDNLHEDEFRYAERLMKKVDDKLYPPKMIVDIYHYKEQAKEKKCDITLHVNGFKGGHNKNMSINFHVHSDCYNEKSSGESCIIILYSILRQCIVTSTLKN